MIAITLLVCSSSCCWVSIYSPPTRESVELVMKLGSANEGERERIQKQLMDRPDALFPTLWGTGHKNSDIATACSQVVEEWSWRSRLAELVRSVGGDFDRFVNSLLYSPDRGDKLFTAVSQKGRALDRYYVRKSFLTDPKGFPSLTRPWEPWLTPFHEFTAYVRGQQPTTLAEGFLRGSSAQEKHWLARCDGVDSDGLGHSIVLTEGNARIARVVSSLVVCGGDLIIERSHSSLIIASGDVRVKRGDGSHGAAHSFIIAGGRVFLEKGAAMAKAVLIAPSRISIAGAAVEPLVAPVLILDNGQKPAQELFAFCDLWADFGLAAIFEDGRVKISKVNSAGPMTTLFKQNDIVLERGKTRIESIGQFRRVLTNACDTGHLEFQVARGGKQVSVQADLKKPAKKW